MWNQQASLRALQATAGGKTFSLITAAEFLHVKPLLSRQGHDMLPEDELIALGAYELIVKLLLAFGIKFSTDNRCRGDIVFEAKTDELATHYE